jgi:hypothetical protein
LPILRALVDAGTHLYNAEWNGDTVLNLLKRNLERFRGRDGVKVEANDYFSSLINAVLPLTFCCAKVIRQNEIPFNEGRRPDGLMDFVSRHSERCK